MLPSAASAVMIIKEKATEMTNLAFWYLYFKCRYVSFNSKRQRNNYSASDTKHSLYSSRALTAFARFPGVKRTKDHKIVHVLGRIF